MPIGQVGLRRRVLGGTPQDPCDKSIGPTSFASDCHVVGSLFGWYKADTLAQADESVMTTWSDSSGSANTLTFTVSAFYQDLYHKHPNAVHTVLFPAVNGTGPNFGATNASLPAGFTLARGSLTAYYVVQYRLINLYYDGLSLTTGPGLLLNASSLHGGITFQSRLQNFFHDTPKVELHCSKAAGMTYAINAPAICGWQVLAAVLDAGNSLMSIYRNGVSIASGVYTPEAATTDSNWTVGGDGAGTGNDFEGNVTEVQLYSVAHSAATVASVSSCLKTRWGLP